MAVNPSSWKSLTLADRDQPFDADDAIARMAERANLGGGGGNAKEYGRGFLWRETDGDPLNRESYRLPIADVVDGDLQLVPHAVYAAAALLSGAHGGLPNVPDDEKDKIRDIISEIYVVLRDTFNDPRIRPPWDRGRPPEDRSDANMRTEHVIDYGQHLPAGEMWGTVSTSDTPTVNPAFATRTATAETDEPDGDCPPGKHKMPDGTCMDDEEMDDGYTLMASGAVKPPRVWFEDPKLTKPTPLTVDENGRVYGHLATWGQCHTGIGNVCVTAPTSAANYSYFTTGEVICDDGTKLAVGKITLGAGHADPALGYIPATEHYDSSAACVAIVRPGEDQHGVWLAGSTVPGLDDARLAELRRCAPSGDWRRVGGNLELIAALAVVVPGFPVVRASGGMQQTLLAAGVVTEVQLPEEPPVEEPAGEVAPSRVDRLTELAKNRRMRRLAELTRS